MEGVPRLPMISCELKISPSNTEFANTLKKYIREHYHEDAESYSKEIKELEQLRMAACKVPRDFTGCSTLKRYYSQLLCLQNRFPMTDEGPACVPFMWSDVYSGMVFNITDIKYEQACILYNIGALHSELGAMDNRTNAEGMKIACTHFQCSAWAFQHLRDSFPQPKGSDMSHDLLQFFIFVMLAQAQECILEKSMLDSRKASITAKVAAQVVAYYKNALNVLNAGSANLDPGCILDIVGSKTFKTWKKFLEFKESYYSSVSRLYSGMQAEEQQKMGERIAWFQAAMDKLNAAIKIAKTMDRDDLGEALSYTMDVIGGKLNAAKKENDFVYHEKVPPVESLPEVMGASLVKGIPFDPSDPDVCGQDIFARLVPMEAHEASSVYSEEKAKLLRRVTSSIEERNQELVAYLSSLQLDRATLDPRRNETLPEQLIEKCAALSVRPTAITDAEAVLDALQKVCVEVDSALKEAMQALNSEEEKERRHQEVFGKRAPSMIVMELKKECGKYEEAHLKAKESNANLKRALEAHLENLRLLMGPLDAVKKSLPSVMEVEVNPEVIQELHRLLDKVDEMQNQRRTLESQLRESIQKDDITKKIVSKGGDKQHSNEDLQVFFSEELKKHDHLKGLLEQNMSAQDNILRALTQANARYADVRRSILEVSARREERIAALVNSFDAYEDLMAKAKKGLDFYGVLQTSIMRLLARVRSVTSVCEEERQQIAQAHGKKMAANRDTSSSGPKLKDYLPFMTARGGPATSHVPPPQAHNYPPSTYQPISGTGTTPVPAPIPTASTPQSQQVASNYPPSTYQPISGTGTTPVPAASTPQSQQVASNYPPSTYQPVAGTGTTPVPAPIPAASTPQSQQAASNYPPSTYQPVAGTGTTSIPAGSTPQPQQVASNYTPSTYQPVAGTGTTPIPAGSTPQPQQVASNYSPSTYQPISSIPSGYQYSVPAPTSSASAQVSYPQWQADGAAGTYTPSYGAPNLYTGTTYTANRYTNPQTPLSYNTSASVATGYGQPPQQQAPIPLPSSSPSDQGSRPLYNSFSASPFQSLPQQFALSPHQTTVSYSTCSDTYMQLTGQNTTLAGSDPHRAYPFDQTAANYQPQTQFSTQTYPYGSNPYPVHRGQQQQPSSSYEAYYAAQYPQVTNSEAYYAQQQQFYQQQQQPAYVQPQQWTAVTPDSSAPLQAPPQPQPAQPAPAPPPPPAMTDPVPIPKSESSAKDLLSTTPERTSGTKEPQATVLQPKVLSSVDLQLQKEAMEQRRRSLPKDPFADRGFLERFVSEVEKFEKCVDGLCKKSLNGPTQLDQKWKEVMDAQDKEARRLSISVARCYPMKNRFPDIMPYDSNRVELTSMRNDYINASDIKGITPNSPRYIVTQAPLPSTYADFWAMVWEQQAEIIVCLLSTAELKSHVYWPQERGQQVVQGPVTVSLQSVKEKQCHVETMISIQHNETRISRVVIHLQFTAWPGSNGHPGSPSQLLQFISEVHNFYRQQRNLLRPLIVHCSGGIGRSGVFCLISSAMVEMAAGQGLLDIVQTAGLMCQQRRFLLQEKEHLKFCFEAVLYHAQDILMKRGILTNKASFSSSSSHKRHPSEDFILGGLAKLQAGVEDLSLATAKDEAPPTIDVKSEKQEQHETTTAVNGNSTDSAVTPITTELPPGGATTVPEAQPKPQCITSLLDPASFTLDPIASSPGRRNKITKESFQNPSASLMQNDPNDPLSQLDPLWTIHKSKQ